MKMLMYKSLKIIIFLLFMNIECDYREKKVIDHLNVLNIGSNVKNLSIAHIKFYEKLMKKRL